MRKYEIEPVYHPGYFFESQICSLTGLELEEVTKHTEKIKTWRGRTYIDLFRELGFNTNPRFMKFDAETKYPCLMRTVQRSGKRTYWYGFVYHDSMVYVIGEGPLPIKMGLYQFTQAYPHLKITSMLQVWI